MSAHFDGMPKRHLALQILAIVRFECAMNGAGIKLKRQRVYCVLAHLSAVPDVGVVLIVVRT